MTALFCSVGSTGRTCRRSTICDRQAAGNGWQPCGLPLDDINIGESTYLQIIHNARKYVYITTRILYWITR
ncbi:MAG: hypothetical protein ACLSDM_06105 [Butyricicoccus sp.]